MGLENIREVARQAEQMMELHVEERPHIDEQALIVTTNAEGMLSIPNVVTSVVSPISMTDWNATYHRRIPLEKLDIQKLATHLLEFGLRRIANPNVLSHYPAKTITELLEHVNSGSALFFSSQRLGDTDKAMESTHIGQGMIADNVLDACLGANLRKVDLTKCDNIRKATLVRLGIKCVNLSQISLKDCKQVENKAVVTILQNCCYLEELNLDGCKRLTDGAFRCRTGVVVHNQKELVRQTSKERTAVRESFGALSSRAAAKNEGSDDDEWSKRKLPGKLERCASPGMSSGGEGTFPQKLKDKHVRRGLSPVITGLRNSSGGASGRMNMYPSVTLSSKKLAVVPERLPGSQRVVRVREVSEPMSGESSCSGNNKPEASSEGQVRSCLKQKSVEPFEEVGQPPSTQSKAGTRSKNDLKIAYQHAFLPGLANIRTLSLSGVTQLTDSAVLHVLRKAKKLETLRLGRCNKVKLTPVVVGKLFGRLKELDLAYVDVTGFPSNSLGTGSSASVMQLMRGATGGINVDRASSTLGRSKSTRGIKLSERGQALQVPDNMLGLGDLACLRDIGEIPLVSLDLSKSATLTDIGVREILQNCTKLKTLKLAWCGSIGDDAFCFESPSFQPENSRLQRLDLRGTCITGRTFKTFLQKLPALDDVSLAWCTTLEFRPMEERATTKQPSKVDLSGVLALEDALKTSGPTSFPLLHPGLTILKLEGVRISWDFFALLSTTAGERLEILGLSLENSLSVDDAKGSSGINSRFPRVRELSLDWECSSANLDTHRRPTCFESIAELLRDPMYFQGLTSLKLAGPISDIRLEDILAGQAKSGTASKLSKLVLRQANLATESVRRWSIVREDVDESARDTCRVLQSVSVAQLEGRQLTEEGALLLCGTLRMARDLEFWSEYLTRPSFAVLENEFRRSRFFSRTKDILNEAEDNGTDTDTDAKAGELMTGQYSPLVMSSRLRICGKEFAGAGYFTLDSTSGRRAKCGRKKVLSRQSSTVGSQLGVLEELSDEGDLDDV